MRPMLQAWPGLARSLAACVACAALVTAGCTMCPDPYDYSGPVPNGSAPQNDFRARSNGILPLDAAAKPFPAVVKAAPQPAPEAVPVVEQPVVAEAETDVLRLAAETPVVPEPDTDGAADSATAGASALSDDVAADAGPEVVSDVTPAVPAPITAETVPEPLPQPQPVPVAAEPALRETPGWRSRR